MKVTAFCDGTPDKNVSKEFTASCLQGNVNFVLTVRFMKTRMDQNLKSA
jgi:hypothetical protein